jgi:hypothetical protein
MPVRRTAPCGDDLRLHGGPHDGLAHGGLAGAHSGEVRAFRDGDRLAQLRDRRVVVLEPQRDHGVRERRVRALGLRPRARLDVALEEVRKPQRGVEVLRG